MPQRAVFFDLDGTLVLTGALQSQAHLQTVHSLGGQVTMDMESLYSRLIGLSFDKTRDEFLRAAHLKPTPPLRAEYTATFLTVYYELIKQLSGPVPGANQLLTALGKAGYRLAMVSSSPREEIERVLAQTGLRSFFEFIVSGEDVKRPKPAPDPYLHAVQVSGLAKQAVVAFEDSESGLQAGLSAGLRVFMVQYDPQDRRVFRGAAGVFHSLEDQTICLKLFEDRAP